MSKLEAVKKAIKAYEKALAELEAVPPRTREAAIMTEHKPQHGGMFGRLTCSECNKSAQIQFSRPNWKFCPNCGAEIIRYDLGTTASAATPQRFDVEIRRYEKTYNLDEFTGKR